MQLSKKEIYELILESVQEMLAEAKKDKEHSSKDRDPRTGEPTVNGEPKTFKSHGSKKPRRLLNGSTSEEETSDMHDAVLDETGEPVCEACLMEYMEEYSDVLEEAKYHGHSVSLGKPMRGDVKKYRVYVRDPKTGNIKKVNFGDPNMRIKRQDPKRRKSFRARHKCSQAKDRTKAKYWSCRFWSKKPVSKMV